MIRTRVPALAAAAIVVASAGCGGGGAAKDVVIGHASASGRHASTSALGKVGRFTKISLRVRAAPSQRVSGSWVIACRGAGSTREAGDVGGRAPLTVALGTVSPAFAGSNSCTVDASATLAAKGHLTVELLAH